VPATRHPVNPQDQVSRAIRATDPLGFTINHNLNEYQSGSRHE
jgi:hypothetical protein